MLIPRMIHGSRSSLNLAAELRSSLETREPARAGSVRKNPHTQLTHAPWLEMMDIPDFDAELAKQDILQRLNGGNLGYGA
jgi:hypothetical protein